MRTGLQTELGRIERVGSWLLQVGADEARRNRLAVEPQQFMAEAGLFVAPGLNIQVHENTRDTFYLVFPPGPNEMLRD